MVISSFRSLRPRLYRVCRIRLLPEQSAGFH
jgi:hypothetical protein